MSAVRDGDDYVLNGQKVYVGSSHGAEMVWTITRTDPDGERHRNLSWFMIPTDTPGITIQPMDLLITSGEGGAGTGTKNTIFFDDVRVPAFNLIGGENNGWQVATTHLELEHGSGGSVRRKPSRGQALRVCYGTQAERTPSERRSGRSRPVGGRVRRGGDISPVRAAQLLDAPHTSGTGSRRPAALALPQEVWSPVGTGHAGDTGALRADQRSQMGTGPTVTWEVFQRASIVAMHPGGTAEIQKVIMARRLGAGRQVREQAGRLE